MATNMADFAFKQVDSILESFLCTEQPDLVMCMHKYCLLGGIDLMICLTGPTDPLLMQINFFFCNLSLPALSHRLYSAVFFFTKARHSVHL